MQMRRILIVERFFPSTYRKRSGRAENLRMGRLVMVKPQGLYTRNVRV